MKNKLMILANDETTIYNFRREIIRALYEHGYDVTLCFPEGEHTGEIEACGCRVINTSVSRHGKNPLHDLHYMQTCRKLIRQYRPDIVLTYTVKPNIYGSLACQIEKVPYINNVTGLGTILQTESKLAKLILQLQKLAYKKSSCVFFQNSANRDVLRQKGVISFLIPTEILPGSGVNLELHSYVPMREDDGSVRFIIVSRLRDDKGYREFFEAAERIKRKHPNTEFHVVGWYEEDDYKKMVEDLTQRGIIIYHGKQVQEEVHKLIASCDCVILPSYHEGMANVLLEGAATGRPIIASNIPGCRESFDEGISGFGCEVKSADSLTKAMEKLISTPYTERVEMGKHGRKKMEEQFDRRLVSELYLKHMDIVLLQATR